MKGIILAGGHGTRLYPITLTHSKQLLPIYDKPMIYYPLSTLMLAGIREILIITTPNDENSFKKLLGNGDKFGLKLEYQVQEKPEGLAHAFLLGRDFIGEEACAMILGDNIFYGNGLKDILIKAKENALSRKRATIFGYYVNDPQRFGIVEFNDKNQVKSLDEKPKFPKSNYAITGLYFYPKGVSDIAAAVTPSLRGELEITSLNKLYLEKEIIDVEIMGRGFAWLDTGTFESLSEAADFVKVIQKRQGIVISAPEEIAYNNAWISPEVMLTSAKDYENSEYGTHLKNVVFSKIKY